ncbi:MAG: CoA transferase [Dehalococcoidales bacterium]|nr:CoA transferase [Dehalococcoidales bacterium]
MSKKALAGIKVIEYASFANGPYAGKLLADLGAEVIKVEPPDGDRSRRYGPFPGDVPHKEKSGLFLWLNSNKQGVTLDLKKAGGRNIFDKLVKDADVLIENCPPKDCGQLGLEYERLKEINPKLIQTSITPFGHTGPYKDFKGYAITCSAAGGASIASGDPGREPLTIPINLSSYEAGACAAIATLHTMLQRQLTGRGQHIDIAESEVPATLYTGRYIVLFLYIGVTGIRRGRHAGYFLYPTTTLQAKDGYMCLIAPQVEQWVRFTEVMGCPEWTKNPRYRDRRAMAEQYPDEADALITSWMMQHTREEIFNLCREKHIPFAPVWNIDEVVNSPHLKERGYFVDIKHPQAGELKYPGFPYKLTRTPCSIERPAPLLGEHNEAVFAGLGYTKEQLAKLKKSKVI